MRARLLLQGKRLSFKLTSPNKTEATINGSLKVLTMRGSVKGSPFCFVIEIIIYEEKFT